MTRAPGRRGGSPSVIAACRSSTCRAARISRWSMRELSLVFNGAIYNYRELRAELQARGHSFVSGGDTEVILKAYREWGDDCPQRLHGMFAFAIWDRARQCLFAARDRFGIKPFYYALTAERFRFASNTQALLAGGGIDTAIDPVGLHFQYTLHAVIPAPTHHSAWHPQARAGAQPDCPGRRPAAVCSVTGTWMRPAAAGAQRTGLGRCHARGPAGGGAQAQRRGRCAGRRAAVRRAGFQPAGGTAGRDRRRGIPHLFGRVRGSAGGEGQRVRILGPGGRTLPADSSQVPGAQRPGAETPARGGRRDGRADVRSGRRGLLSAVRAGLESRSRWCSRGRARTRCSAAISGTRACSPRPRARAWSVFANTISIATTTSFCAWSRQPTAVPITPARFIAARLDDALSDDFLDAVLKLDTTTLIVDDPVKRVDNMTMALGPRGACAVPRPPAGRGRGALPGRPEAAVGRQAPAETHCARHRAGRGDRSAKGLLPDAGAEIRARRVPRVHARASSIRRPAASAACSIAPTWSGCWPRRRCTTPASWAASCGTWRCWNSGCSATWMAWVDVEPPRLIVSRRRNSSLSRARATQVVD